MVTPVQDALRTQTHQAHQLLHEHSSFVGLFEQTLELDDYRLLTQRLFGFYAPLDHAIFAVLNGQGADAFDYAGRSELLAQDMKDLGFGKVEIEETPRCKAIADIISPASVGGVLYVVEGATLGGSLIDRAAQKLLGDDLPDRRRYWAWCRAQGKHRWKMFNAFAQQLSGNEDEIAQVTKGAKDTFDIFSDWLAPLDKPRTIRERVKT